MMNLGQARIIDPILTEFVREYSNKPLIGDALFPTVPVPVRKGQIIKFGKERFVAEQTSRAPGQEVNYLQVGYEAEQYSVLNDGLGWKLPIEVIEEAREVAHVDLVKESIQAVITKMRLGVEVRRATMALSPTSYPASNVITPASADLWSNTASDPFELVVAAKKAVRQQTGHRPNVMVIGPDVLDALSANLSILDRTKYTSRDSITLDMLRQLFQVETLVIGEAITADPVTGNFTDIWGPNVVLAFVDQISKSRQIPSYGYTYKLKGSPSAGPERWDPDTRSWKGDIFWEQQDYITSAQAGFLIQSVL